MAAPTVNVIVTQSPAPLLSLDLTEAGAPRTASGARTLRWREEPLRWIRTVAPITLLKSENASQVCVPDGSLITTDGRDPDLTGKEPTECGRPGSSDDLADTAFGPAC